MGVRWGSDQEDPAAVGSEDFPSSAPAAGSSCVPRRHVGAILERVFGHPPPARPPGEHGDDRPVRPPRPVWVDLARVFPRSGPVRPFPSGWNMQDQVPGELFLWGRTTVGDWVGLVRFRVRRGDNSEGMIHTQCVLGLALSPREDAPARHSDGRSPY